MNHPRIIQGGMGIGVSGWRLSKAVAQLGQLGVVSGTSLDVLLCRRLQDGDPGGHYRRALAHFPVPEAADKLLKDYFLPKGRPQGHAYKPVPMLLPDSGPSIQMLTVLGNFAEIYLAREGHGGLVGLNLLEKIQLPHISALYGAMLAGVDYVIMGAGIPRQIPAILDKLANHEAVQYRLNVDGARDGETFAIHLDPRELTGRTLAALKRPNFLPIISSATLAVALARKATGRIDGFVVEGPLAGGHNAPPRAAGCLNERGEPIYGEADKPDWERIRGLGLPFWIAGSFADREKLHEALSLGAAGIQVGTAFAFCEESGIEESTKTRVLELVRDQDLDVFTDPLASPTGFPFKVASVPGTMSEEEVYAERERVCDIGLLRQFYRKDNGAAGTRCPAEPLDHYVAKGGRPEDTVGRKCICNGLLAGVGSKQRRESGYTEVPIITAGDDLVNLWRFLKPGRLSYSARDVIESLLGGADPEPEVPGLGLSSAV